MLLGALGNPVALPGHPLCHLARIDAETHAKIEAEIDRELDPEEQATIVADAADRSPAPAATDRPIAATLGRLEERELIGEHDRASWDVDRDRSEW